MTLLNIYHLLIILIYQCDHLVSSRLWDAYVVDLLLHPYNQICTNDPLVQELIACCLPTEELNA